MALLKQWRDAAYSETTNKGDLQRMWQKYFDDEKNIYAELLQKPDEVVTGTVKELADKFGVTILTMTGFLDGINDSLKEANPIEEMEEDTVVSLAFDKEKLYKNMVAKIKEEYFPILIGGDHSVSIASALASAKVNIDVGIIWIDAHGDFNTFDTTITV